MFLSSVYCILVTYGLHRKKNQRPQCDGSGNCVSHTVPICDGCTGSLSRPHPWTFKGVCALSCLIFWELDFDSELMFAKGVPRITHTHTHHIRDVQCVRPSRDDPGCIVSVRFETYDVLRDGFCDILSHTVPFSELEVAPEEHPVLLANVLWNSKTHRERSCSRRSTCPSLS